MDHHKLLSITLLLILNAAFGASSARILDEQPPPAAVLPPPAAVLPPPAAVLPPPAAVLPPAEDDNTIHFFMHDILGGTNPTARAVTGVVNNPAVNGQVPFAKPNGAVLPVSNGVRANSNNNGILNNNNLPFLTGLGGPNSQTLVNGNNNNGFNNFPVVNGGQLQSGSTAQELMFGTMTVIDDELTEGHELGSGLVGKAQGFYVASAVDGTSQTMAFTVMFEGGGYADGFSLFGVHRTAVSESQLAIMGGTGKYVNAKGYAVVKTVNPGGGNVGQLQETDGVETILEFTVYVSY